MRLVQHKKEAYWFYSFLSNFYDKIVNPLFWTKQMRDQSLELAQFDSPDLTVVDVGSGTGFTTEGIVKHIDAKQINCIDQSPHQMAKAKKKEVLQECHFQVGDAENLPFPTDHFDRYVSAGSIEYWPDPQRGIAESYRVIKPGGVALMIGPLEPTNPVGRLIADIWMLFPKEKEYMDWYEKAGFEDVQVRYVKPQWAKGKSKYGIAISGRKPAAGDSPAVALRLAEEPEKMTVFRWLTMVFRVIIGSLAGFLFIPAALFGYIFMAFDKRDHIPKEYRERLNGQQITALVISMALIVGLIYWII